MPTPVTATATAASIPTPVDMSAIAGMLGGSIDFATLLNAQFGEFAAADGPLITEATTDTALSSEAPTGQDLAALLVVVPPAAVATPVAETALSLADAGSDAMSLTTGLLQNIGEARANLQGKGGEAANFAVEDLPLGGSTESPLPVLQHSTAHRESAGTTSTATARVDTPFGDARWSTDFNQKIVWMARQDLQSAQISINPPNLGPIDVSLQLGGDQATAVFSSPHAEVREALESALPRLREMLAGAGISLGQAQVGAQHQQSANQQGNPGSSESQRFADGSILAGANEVRQSAPLRHQHGSGLVDIFA